MNVSPGPRRLISPPLRRWAGLLGIAVLVVGGAAAALIAAAWYRVTLPDGLVRGATIGFLRTIRTLYALTLATAPVSAVVLGAAIIAARRTGRRMHPAWAKGLLLAASLTIGLGLLEVGAAARQATAHRLANLPRAFPESGAPGDLNVLVVGESSALGTPYDPHISVGQIIAWQLQRVFPARKVRVEVLAQGGMTLEGAVSQFRRARRRPDVVLIYSGHNEFQGRYGWARTVRHYREEGPVRFQSRLAAWAARHSPFCAVVAETLERHQLDVPPPPRVTRDLVDRPAFTPEEYQHILDDYARRLDGLVAHVRSIGAVPIVVVVAGNDAGYPPARSYLDPATPPADRAAFARAFTAARVLESTDPARAEAAYRELERLQPDFAETHYRLGRLAEARGDRAVAATRFARARDLDGMPMRCPSDFQDVCRVVADRRGAVLVDGPRVLAALSPSGLLDDNVFHDAQHPTFRAYLALARQAVGELRSRGDLGWPASTPAMNMDPDDCAAHFHMNAAVWTRALDGAASFYARVAYMRYDPAENLAKARRITEAARRVAAGEPLEAIDLPGLGVHPRGFRDPPRGPAGPRAAPGATAAGAG